MSKSDPLVCEHLEYVSRKALEEHQDIVRKFIRYRQGVYALYRKGKLYRVGLTTDLRSRLGNYLRGKHKNSWDHFSVYLTIGVRYLHDLETLMLHVMKPPGNQQKGQFVRARDLRGWFRQQYMRSFKAKVKGLFGEMGVIEDPPKHEKGSRGRVAVLAKYLSGPMLLRARHKGERITARVRSDGTILLAGKVYTSPSVAGAVACKRKSCNGWRFWTYERAPGDWVKLDERRKQ